MQIGAPREDSQAYIRVDFHLHNSIHRTKQSCVRAEEAATRTLLVSTSTIVNIVHCTSITRAVAWPAALHCSCVDELDHYCCAAVPSAVAAALLLL